MPSDRYEFYKENRKDKIWWVYELIEDEDEPGVYDSEIGAYLFTFDKKKIYSLFTDYPHALTPEEKEIFDKENPYWADFFKDRR